MSYTLPKGPASITGNAISSNVYTAGRQPDTSIAGQTTYSNVGSYTFTNFGNNIALTPTTTGITVSMYFTYTSQPYGNEGLWSLRLASDTNQAMFARTDIGVKIYSVLATLLGNAERRGYSNVGTSWYSGRIDHILLTFSATTPSVITLYVNGYIDNSITPPAQTMNPLPNGLYQCFVPGNLFGSADANMSVYDFRIINGTLSASQVAMLYRTLSGNNVPVPSPPMICSGAPLFYQLSASATSSAVGAFSLRAVNGTSAKAVQVRNGTTSAIQDFWADRLGNLLTAPVTGQTLANWLGAATGYVTTWYDQSGQGNHASQATAVNQPTLNLSNASISFSGSQWLSNASPTNMFIPLYQNSYSIVTKHGQWTAGGTWSTGNTASFLTNSFNGLRWATGNYYQNFKGGGFLTFGPQPGTFPVVATVVNNRTTDIGYINGVQSATTTVIAPVIEAAYSQYIGQDINGGVKMQGELYSVVFFKSALSTADRTVIENLV